MRTSSKFIEGREEEFVGVFRNYFPAGKVCIVAQDAEEGDRLARAMGKDYLVTVRTPEKAEGTGARFFLGVGGSGVIAAVKRAAGSEKYAFLPAIFDYRFLYSFDGKETLPEFVYLTERARSEEKDFCVRLYVTLFQLYAESVFEAFYTSAFPYRDGGSERFRISAERFLRGEEERSTYAETGIRLVTDRLNEAFAARKGALLTEKASERYGVTSGERFTVAFFLLLMLKNFTKHPFRAILLPSEKPTRADKKASVNAFDARCLPSDELLRTVKRKVSFLTETPVPDARQLLRVLGECADAHPVFAILQEEGITDALYYEGSEERKSLFV